MRFSTSICVRIALLAAVLAACAPAARTPAAPVTELQAPLARVAAVAPERSEPVASGDPLSCAARAAIAPVGDVATTVWSPDSRQLALERIHKIPSKRTVTGWEEEVHVEILDVTTGAVRDLGEAHRVAWSGSGALLSMWWARGLEVVSAQDGRVVHRFHMDEVSMPEVSWVGDELRYWSGNEIHAWTRAGGIQGVSTVAPQYVPRYPRDDVTFSADGELFALTRYGQDGSASRWIGQVANGQVAPMNAAGAVLMEWSPRGQTLLVRSEDRIALRAPGGVERTLPLSTLAGKLHGWAPDGTSLLVGAVEPTVPGGTALDAFSLWNGTAMVGTATLPNVLGARAFSPDGKWFAGVERTSLYGLQLALFACGTGATPRADPIARSRQQQIEADPRRFVRPVAGAISQFLQGAHTGVDVSAPYGTTIVAADDGTVNSVQWVPVGGRRVCVMHAGGLESCYYHTATAYVSVGQKVSRGQPIAAIGMTGATTGPHVHWEVKLNGRIVDPLNQ